MRSMYALAVVAAVAGTVLAVIAFVMPETGVTGSLGAILVIVGSAAAALGSLLLAAGRTDRPRLLLVALTVLSAVLTAVAAWFLMQYPLLGAMVAVVLLALAGSVFSERRSLA